MNNLKMVVGTTENNEIVIAEINNKNYFSVCFDVVAPMEFNEGYLQERLDNFVEDVEEVYEDKEDIPSILYNINIYQLEQYLDISLYPETHDINDVEYFYESVGCGQCDERGNLEYEADEDLNKLIFDMWDEYHLKELDGEGLKRLEAITDALSNYDLDDMVIDATKYIIG